MQWLTIWAHVESFSQLGNDDGMQQLQCDVCGVSFSGGRPMKILAKVVQGG